MFAEVLLLKISLRRSQRRELPNGERLEPYSSIKQRGRNVSCRASCGSIESRLTGTEKAERTTGAVRPDERLQVMQLSFH